MHRVIIDIDGTLTPGNSMDYANVRHRPDGVAAVRSYRDKGFEIVTA